MLVQINPVAKFLPSINKVANTQMQPILTAVSFRLNWGQFQIQLVYGNFSDAVKTADLIVMCKESKVEIVK